ncbi:MAG: EamA family transporter RarD [Nannocystaceae bacterium]|nr:EamA family transporter RarD [Nannocystaceae bacterium]
MSTGARTQATIGLGYGLAAYLTWGVLPLYFAQLRQVPALQTLAHRVIWATVLLALFVTVRGQWRAAIAQLCAARLRWFLLTTLLLSTNWLVYIGAVNTGRVLEASLGYFVTPLVNVLLGVWLLRERLGGAQRFAVGLAALSVAVLVIGTGVWPTIPLLLAGSFGTYGLVRKRLAIAPMTALLVETALMVPPAAVFLGLSMAGVIEPPSVFGQSLRLDLLLLASGAVTALPLVWFGHAAQRLQLSTLGTLQYLSPSCSFILAITVLGEPLSRWHVVAFAGIWIALGVYATAAARQQRRAGAQ